MKYQKIATAQLLLRKLAGYKVPIVLGAGLLAGAHTLRSGLHKSKEYKAGFQPGYFPEEH